MYNIIKRGEDYYFQYGPDRKLVDPLTRERSAIQPPSDAVERSRSYQMQRMIADEFTINGYAVP